MIKEKELHQAFSEIQMPRPPFVLNDLVVNARFTDEQKYAQCTLELYNAYCNLHTAEVDRDIMQATIDSMRCFTKKQKLERKKKQIELEMLEYTMLWAMREFNYLYDLREKRPKKYTREELNEAQPLEYKMKLETQALHDIMANGKVSVWNLEWLRQLGIGPRMALQEQTIEQKYLSQWKIRLLIAIPSKDKLTPLQQTQLLDWIELPTNAEIKEVNYSQMPVADNYNRAIDQAIQEWCTHLLTLEDDQVLEKDSIIRLLNFSFANPDCCVWAWYPKRQKTREWVHIVIEWNHRHFLNDDGWVHEVYTLAMGLSVYPVHILKQLEAPYCLTTNALTQDSYLSQKIRDLWYKLLVDTSIKIWHKDTDWSIYY